MVRRGRCPTGRGQLLIPVVVRALPARKLQPGRRSRLLAKPDRVRRTDGGLAVPDQRWWDPRRRPRRGSVQPASLVPPLDTPPRRARGLLRSLRVHGVPQAFPFLVSDWIFDPKEQEWNAGTLRSFATMSQAQFTRSLA